VELVFAEAPKLLVMTGVMMVVMMVVSVVLMT
jgi:hypothetical protein